MFKDYKISLLADYYGAMLSERALDTVRKYYDGDMSLGEIAALYGVSRQAVSETLAKATASLQEYETKLSLAAKAEWLRDTVDKVSVDCAKGDCAAAIERLKTIRKEL